LTPEDREEIQAMITEAFLKMPEVVAALFQEKLVLQKMRDQFYAEHKSFEKHKDIVASVMEEFEGKNPGKPYEQLLKESVLVVQRRIDAIGKVSMKQIDKPTDLTFHAEHGAL
jgi:hypothetical protein